MHELGVRPIRTFTIGFEEKSFSETDTGARGGEALRHRAPRADRPARRRGAAAATGAHFDEPFADSSAIPVYHVSELARRHVKVVLSGEGGDEVLAGYETYRARRSRRSTRGCRAAIGEPARAGDGATPAGLARPRQFRLQGEALRHRRVPSARRRPPVVEDDPRPRRRKPRCTRTAWRATCAPTVRLFEALFAESDGDELDRLQYIDATLYLPADILVKVDRMSMAHSLEARVPFLDRAMLELARRIPSRLRLRGLTTQVSAAPRHGRSPAGRASLNGKKRGFNVPMPSWLAGELRDFTRDTLSPQRLRRQGLFEPAAVERLVAEPSRAPTRS